MSAQIQPVVYSFSDTSILSDSLAEYILKAQKESIDKRGRFTVAISGGSLPKTLTPLISKSGVRWDKWQVALSPFCIPLFTIYPSLQACLLCRLNASCRSTTPIPTTGSRSSFSSPKFPSRQEHPPDRRRAPQRHRGARRRVRKGANPRVCPKGLGTLPRL